MVNNLALRMLSSLVLAPLMLYVLYLGGIYFQMLALVCLFLMLYEWFSMNGRNKNPLFISFALGLGAFALSKVGVTNFSIYDIRHVMYAFCITLIGSILSMNNRSKMLQIVSGTMLSLVGYLIIHMLVASKPYGAPVKDLAIFAGSIIVSIGVTFLLDKKNNETKFFIAGIIYILIPMLYVSLKAAELREHFFKIAIWILTIVWSCDILAYFGGRLIGGAKLAPKISPNKTWSGAIVGAVATMILSYFAMSKFMQIEQIDMYVLSVTAIMIIAAILGDLLESKAKRILNVKDSGNIIPGHGGILDRFDSVLMVLYVFVIAEILCFFKLDLKMLLTSAKWV